MQPTELIYSSHERCEHLHRDWLVQRALESWTNKTLLYVPFSSGARGDQEYSWGTFSWYLDRFRGFGLEPRVFFWDDHLRREDVDRFFGWLYHSQVVILGGGRTDTGLRRFWELGDRWLGDGGKFLRVLRERQARGFLTAGFSAGADQLAQYSCDGLGACLGLSRNVIVQLHYDHSRAGHLEWLARQKPDCHVFGLPNDSGIAVNQGTTAHGNLWQMIRFVVDRSWDKPEDQHHIKTRQGLKIVHRYADGREWVYDAGDSLLRVIFPDGVHQRAWIGSPHQPSLVDYWTQQPTGLHSFDEVLASW
jgi:hypothetical protein